MASRRDFMGVVVIGLVSWTQMREAGVSRDPGENMRQPGFSQNRRADLNRTRVFRQGRGVSSRP